MNNGKKFEKIVRLIQEALKDLPNTEIFSNFKMENVSGRKREIDILLKSSFNQFELLIAIECKDYKKAVSVDKIEAFNSKCQRIHGISKKIFVAPHGYQADAIDAANDFDIDLYDFNKIDQQDIIQWFSIKQLTGSYLLKQPFSVFFDAHESELNHISVDNELIIHFEDNREPILLEGLLWNTVVYENQKELKSHLIYEFMKNDSNLNYQTIFPFTIKYGGIYAIDKIGVKIRIVQVKASVIGWLEEKPAKIIEARTYSRKEETPQASLVSIAVDDHESADIIYTDSNDICIFHTDSNGTVRKLETLMVYDPKKDEFTFNKKNEG